MAKVNDANKSLIKTREQSPASVIEKAIAGGANLAEVKELMILKERWDANEAKKVYAENFAIAQGEIEGVVKTKVNPQTQSKYASLENIIESVKPVYTKYGFAVIFYENESTKEGHIRICADVLHKAGHKETYYYDLPLDDRGIKGTVNKTLIHAKSSSASYGRRYLMCMIWNIPTPDDDAKNIDVKFITETQLSNIVDLIADLKVNEISFCKFMKVDKPEDILASDYQKAIVSLEAKRTRDGQSK